MRRIAYALFALLALISVASAQTVTVTAQHITGINGAPLGQGYLCFTPVNGNGSAQAFVSGGVQYYSSEQCWSVFNGVATGINIPDTTQTTPAIGYAPVIRDVNRAPLQAYTAPFYPTAASANFDTFVPGSPVLSTGAGLISFGSTVPTSPCTSPAVGYLTNNTIYTCGTDQQWHLLSVSFAGGTLTQPLILAADPSTALGAATKQYVDAHASAGGATVPSVTNVIGGNGAGSAVAVPEKGITSAGAVAWSEDYDNGIFDCRNPKYGSGGCKGSNPAQAMQDLADAMTCYAATTGKHPTTFFPPGTFKVGLPSKPALIFPAGGNYYGAGQSLNGGGTIFQATYNNSNVVQWNTGQSAICSDGLSHTSNISGGTVSGIGEHGCAQGGCIATPGDSNDYAGGGGPGQGGLFVGDSQGNVSFLAASSNGGYGIHMDGQDTRAMHLWGASNTSWWIYGKYATHIAVPVPGTPTTSTTGGTLAAGTYYYKVTATGNAIVGGAGETTGSVEKSVTTTGTTSTVTLSWPAVTNATGYKVYRGTAAGGESVYYTTATNSFTDTGAAAPGGSVPTASTATYNPAGDGFHGSIEVFNYDGQTDYVEDYGRFDAAGAEYGHIAGLLAVGGASSYSHIFNQLDEIGVIIPFGNDGLRMTQFRIDAPHGDGVVVNANAILTDGTVLNDCQDSGILALNHGHCSGINSGLGTYMSQISHQLANGTFGPEHSTGFIYGGGHIGANVDGPIQGQTSYAALPYDTYALLKSFAGENGSNVTGPSPDVSFLNGIHPVDTAVIGYTKVTNAMDGQGLYVKADNANVKLLGPGSGGHWHNCNGGDLSLGLSGVLLHYTAVASLYGGEELWEQCDGQGAGVASLNGLQGAVSLVAGNNVTITPSGQSITIAATATAATPPPSTTPPTVQQDMTLNASNSKMCFPGGTADNTYGCSGGGGVGNVVPAVVPPVEQFGDCVAEQAGTAPKVNGSQGCTTASPTLGGSDANATAYFNLTSPSGATVTANGQSGDAQVLFAHNASNNCPNCSYYQRDVYFKLSDQSASYLDNLEMDTFHNISTTNGLYMFGWQCNRYNTGYWQYDNEDIGWRNTTVPCSLAANHTYHMTLNMHRVPGQTSCTYTLPGSSTPTTASVACEYFDTFTLADITAGTSTTYDLQNPSSGPAAVLPVSSRAWSTVLGSQWQLDAKTNLPAAETIGIQADNDILSASTSPIATAASSSGSGTVPVGQTGNLASYNFDSTAGTPSLSTGTPTFNTTTAYTAPSAVDFNAASEYYTSASWPAAPTVYARAYVRINTAQTTSNLKLLDLYGTGGAEVFNLYLNGVNSYLTAYNQAAAASTVCASSAFPVGSWHYIEFFWQQGTGTAGAFTVKVDGVAGCTITGVNTGSIQATTLKFGEVSASSPAWDFEMDNVDVSNTGYLGAITFTAAGSAPASTAFESVPYSATPTFSVNTVTSYMLLTGDVTNFTLASGTDGQLKRLIFCQDSVGGHVVNGPTNVRALMTLNGNPSKCGGEQWVYVSGQGWLATGAPVVNQ